MEWTITDKDVSSQDVTGVEGLILRMDRELRAGGTPIEGFRFLNSSAEMFRYSQEIEKEVRASPAGACLYTGFQVPEKLLAESRKYQRLIHAGVTVVAFGQGMLPESPDGLAEIWTPLEPDNRALENQWFLVSSSPVPIAFVGWETSPEPLFGRGRLTAPGKQFKGFATNDDRVVHAVIAHLESVRAKATKPFAQPDNGRKTNRIMGHNPHGRRTRIRCRPFSGPPQWPYPSAAAWCCSKSPLPHISLVLTQRKTGTNG